MKIKVYIEKDNRNTSLLFKGKTVRDLLNQLGILSSSSIVTINNEVITEDDTLDGNGEIKILSVISGG